MKANLNILVAQNSLVFIFGPIIGLQELGERRFRIPCLVIDAILGFDQISLADREDISP